MKLSFHGAAREVTGACYLLESDSAKILIDCGLFQGRSECEDLNFVDFKFDPKSIDAVLVSHAHLDHIGRIPKLVRNGFSGTIYSTAPTRDLARLVLEDALHLAQREKQALYDEQDLKKTFTLWQELPYHSQGKIQNIPFQFDEAGHILGSALIEVWAEEKHLLFTGDLGNVPSVLIPPPERVQNAEYLIIESTYGNRTHEDAGDRALLLERAVEDVATRRGTLMIPAFATERAQDILHLLNEMILYKRVPDIPVFVDSPLAIQATLVYEKYPDLYKDEIQKMLQTHPNLFRFKKLQFTDSVEESKHINEVPAPKVIIAGSGMMSGGRILHHARRYLPDKNSMLLIIGYQAAGSLGRRLIEGEKMVKMFGEEVSVAAEIRKINGFSAHADNPQLYAYAESNKDTLKHVFVIHGEEAQALYFSQEIRDHLGVTADAPTLYQEFEL